MMKKRGVVMEYNSLETELLIKRIQAGDESAFQQLYQEWYPKAYYIALAITHHEADAKDAAQETMIEIHRSIHNLRDVKYFKLWLNRIVLSKCNRIFRKKKAVTMDEEQSKLLNQQEEQRKDFLPTPQMHKQSDESVLQSLMCRIPAIYADVLMLMYFEQRSVKEIAHLLHIPEGTVKSRLSSGKAKLKEEICRYEEQEHIRLDFQGRSLETVLAGLVLSNGTHRFTKLLGSKAVVFFAATVLLFSTLQVGWNVYQAQDHQDQSTVSEFEAIQFKHLTVASEKDAYFVLLKYAHCEKELSELNAEELQKIDWMKARLLQSNSAYSKLWSKKK